MSLLNFVGSGCILNNLLFVFMSSAFFISYSETLFYFLSSSSIFCSRVLSIATPTCSAALSIEPGGKFNYVISIGIFNPCALA